MCVCARMCVYAYVRVCMRWGLEVGRDGIWEVRAPRAWGWGGPYKALAFPWSEIEATGEFWAEE